MEEKFSGWEPGETIRSWIEEFEEKKTLEARLASDADVIEALVELKFKSLEGKDVPASVIQTKKGLLRTAVGKELAQALWEEHPVRWVEDLFGLKRKRLEN